MGHTWPMGRFGRSLRAHIRAFAEGGANNAYVIGAIAVASALAAVGSGNEPTGEPIVDALFVAGFAGAVTWLGASTSWWALITAAGIATAGAIGGPPLLLVAALVALGAGVWMGATDRELPIARAVLVATIVQVLLRLQWSPFFLASALLAAVAAGLMVLNSTTRPPRRYRKPIYLSVAGAVVFVMLALVGAAMAAFGARTSARDGYIAMLDGLELVQRGETQEAAARLRSAAADLRLASRDFDGSLSQPARLLPGVAQNLRAASTVLARAADSAQAAAAALEAVDLRQLTVRNGVIDLDIFGELEAPLDRLQTNIERLDRSLREADSPWLVPPFRSRLTEGMARSHQAVPQARATAAAARIAPAMLGADGTRHYFVAFVNNAEARGQSGLMGNWSEIAIDDGRLEVTASGRTAELQSDALFGLSLDVSDEYLARYGPYGATAGLGRGVSPKFWSNATFPPDMPSVGTAMSQMYEQVTGRAVDGVIVIDPAGIASLLAITGPIRLDAIDRRINAKNAEEFLQLGQYEFEENVREDLLETVIEQTIDNALGGDLPPPQRMLPLLADAALHGHISVWAVRPEEEELLELVGIDAALPVVTDDGVDAFAVSSMNASGNKIETFLERTIDYRPTVDERSGHVTAQLRVEITNTAPTSGYSDYVIGNILDDPANFPVGSNRMLTTVHTRLAVLSARLDDQPLSVDTLPELGYNAWTVDLTIPSGQTSVLELQLEGNIGPGAYHLVYRPQPLPNVDRLDLQARRTDGRTIFDFEGELPRRTILSADIIEAWRP